MSKTGKTTFPTLAAISGKYGIHRNTIGGWFASPDAPKRGPRGFDFDEVEAWVLKCAERDRTQAKVSPEMAAAKLEEIQQRVRKLRIANDEREQRLLPVEWVVAKDVKLAERFKAILYGKLVDELPADFTNDVATNRALCRNVVDRLLTEIASWHVDLEVKRDALGKVIID